MASARRLPRSTPWLPSIRRLTGLANWSRLASNSGRPPRRCLPPRQCRPTGRRKPVCENAITRHWPVLYPACSPRHFPYCVSSPGRGPGPPEPEELQALLEAVAPAGAQALAMMIALALGWLPRSELLIQVVDDFARRHDDPAVSATVDGAVDFVLARIEQSPLPSADLTTAAVEARQIAVMLGDLMQCSAQRPRRRNRVEQVRREVDTACRERFAVEIETQLIAPSTGIAAAGDDTIEALEAAARGLRRFEGAARQIGSAEQYDQQLQRAAEALRPKPDEDAVAHVSRVRLVEILRGSDAAVTMLK
jgi:hypothetical protein